MNGLWGGPSRFTFTFAFTPLSHPRSPHRHWHSSILPRFHGSTVPLVSSLLILVRSLRKPEAGINASRYRPVAEYLRLALARRSALGAPDLLCIHTQYLVGIQPARHSCCLASTGRQFVVQQLGICPVAGFGHC